MRGEPEAVSMEYQQELAREACIRRAIDRQLAWREEKEKIIASLDEIRSLLARGLPNGPLHSRDRAGAQGARRGVRGRGGDRLLSITRDFSGTGADEGARKVVSRLRACRWS